MSLDEITLQKRDRAYVLAVHEIPKTRAIGLGILSIAIYFHNRYLLHDPSTETWLALTAIFVAYAAITAIATRYFYRSQHVDLSLLFLVGDVLVLTLAVYFSGAENSWLYPVLLTKVADQTPTTYRRCLMFTVLVTAAYSMMLLFVSTL